MDSIIAEGLIRRFNGFTAVDNLSFRVEEGEIFGILGPNGAGKTTTIRILAALLTPTEGHAFVDGYETRSDGLKVREVVGILTENPSLYERLTPLENLEFFARAYGVEDTASRKTKIYDLLVYFNLWERRDDRVSTFSKGMKQKLALARALVHDPKILFLDEPTSGLDPKSSKDIRDLMEQLSHKESQTILLSTHRLEDAERLCDSVMIINKGRRVTVSSPENLRSQMIGAPVIKIELVEVSKRILEVTKNMDEVSNAHIDGNTLILTLEDKSATPSIVRSVVEAGEMILRVEPREISLEDAYLKLMESS